MIPLEHFIYDCTNTLDLWNSIMNWWKNEFEFIIPIIKLEIIFGVPNENKDSYINQLNTIILFAKFCIYNTKKEKKRTNLYDFLLLLKNVLKLKT